MLVVVLDDPEDSPLDPLEPLEPLEPELELDVPSPSLEHPKTETTERDRATKRTDFMRREVSGILRRTTACSAKV
mgnify:CR=1 FL=1